MASNTAACTMAMSRVRRLGTRSADTVLTAIVFQSVTTSALAICGTPRSAAVLAIRIERSWFMCTLLHSAARNDRKDESGPESFYLLTREIQGNLLTVS